MSRTIELVVQFINGGIMHHQVSLLSYNVEQDSFFEKFEYGRVRIIQRDLNHFLKKFAHLIKKMKYLYVI